MNIVSINKELLFFVVCAVMIFLLPPVLSLIFILTVFVLILKEVNFAIGLFVVLISVVFAFINQQKEIVSDLYNYQLYFNYVKDSSIYNIFNGVFVSIKPTEFFFYIYNLMSSSVMSFKQYMFATSFLIYSLILSASSDICKTCYSKMNISFEKIELVFLVVVFCAFISITFSQTLHLIRQYLAIAFFFCGWALFERNKTRKAFFVFAVSVFVHNSIVVVLAIFFMSYYLSLKVKKSIGLVFVCGFLALFSSVLNWYISSYYSYYHELNNGSVPLSLFLIDSLLVVLYSILLFPYKDRLKTLYYFPVSYFLFLVCFLTFDFIFLRYYFLMDIIRVVVFCFLMMKFGKTFFYYSLPFLLTFSVVVFLYRFYSSVWDYGFDKIAVFENPVIWFLSL